MFKIAIRSYVITLFLILSFIVIYSDMTTITEKTIFAIIAILILVGLIIDLILYIIRRK